MPRIECSILIHAPIEVVFDLARSIDLHQESTRQTGEKAVAGKTSGLIGLGEQVTWEATHFGIRQRLTSEIVQLQRPNQFRDSMVNGAFARFDHDHFFESADDGTRMTDVFDYTAPWGWAGRVADCLFLKRYLTRFLAKRNAVIKSVAESGNPQRFLRS